MFAPDLLQPHSLNFAVGPRARGDGTRASVVGRRGEPMWPRVTPMGGVIRFAVVTGDRDKPEILSEADITLEDLRAVLALAEYQARANAHIDTLGSSPRPVSNEDRERERFQGTGE